MSNSGDLDSHFHVALFTSAGMGHLTPLLRLAASLVQNHCRVTLITTQPIVSIAESKHISCFLSAYPQVAEKQFHLLPLDPTSANSTDHFFLQWEAIRRSAHLLHPILSSTTPPLHALITDVTLISSALPITRNLGLPNYIFFTSSGRMFSLLKSYPDIVASKTSSGSVQFDDDLEIPGHPPIPVSSVPPALLDLNNLFATIFLQNGQNFIKSNGILINTFEVLEADTLEALNGRRESDGLPPIYAIGPLMPCEFERRVSSTPVEWLDEQPDGSVVYVSFGSRTALSKEQMKELGNGLLSSGCKFLWVVKGTKIDKEDKDELDDVLGRELGLKIKDHGLIRKHWVDQEKILSHRAIGGFVTHGGWNSLVEAAWHGMRLLVWPQSGDQKINAEVIARSGLGVWPESWGWGIQVLVKGDDIGQKIKNMMENELLKEQAAYIGEKAKKAVGIGGSSERKLKELLEQWKNSRTV